MGVYGPVTTDIGVGTYDGIGGPNIVGNGGYRMYGRLTFEPDKTLFPLPSESGVGEVHTITEQPFCNLSLSVFSYSSLVPLSIRNHWDIG